MKRILSVLLLVLLLVLPLAACATVSPALDAVATPTLAVNSASVLGVLVTLVVQFASLTGVAGLLVLIVNLGKAVKLIPDGSASKVLAWLNVAAFIALGLLGVFRPDIALGELDNIAVQVTTVLLFIVGFFVQTGVQAPIYDSIRGKYGPLGASYSLARVK